MIIDCHCHCHAGKGDGFTGPWDTRAPLEKFLRWSAGAGIDRTVLFAAFHSDYAAANREIAHIVASRPDRFYGFAFVHTQHGRGRILDMIRIAVKQYGFVGIKVHRHDAPSVAKSARRQEGFRYRCSTMSAARYRFANCSPRNIRG